MSLNTLMIGATGLVGGLALPGLAARAAAEGGAVFVVGRRVPEPLPDAVQALAGAFDESRVSRWLGTALKTRNQRLEVFVSCLGTTFKQAGSRAAFRAVDFDLVRQMADVARHFGANQAVVVTSVGADPDSANFYLQTKGELEIELAGLGFRRCDFLQPGLLIGDRGGPARLAEGLGQRVLPMLNPLLLGRLSQYRSIAARSVAGAVINSCGRREAGLYRHTYESIMALANPAS